MSVDSTNETGLARAKAAVVNGVSGLLVEANVASGLPSIGIVGLPDTSVAESRHRVRCAIESSGFPWPMRRITVSLTPAEVRKSGSGLDLAIAVAILAASGQVPSGHLADTVLLGELALDGTIHAPRGGLALALAARQAGVRTVITASTCASQVARVPGLDVYSADCLTEAVALVGGCSGADPVVFGSDTTRTRADEPDMCDVRGHREAAFALEVAAAGRHHISITGPPGVGKSLLADRLPGLLADLGDSDQLDVAAIHSLVGEGWSGPRPPVAKPHHTASAAALLGAVRGSRVVPGAVTLAHLGVLVLDEAPELARPSLEGLRQPLESGQVSMHRAGWNGVLPARFQLVITANPCPCGQRTGSGRACTCSSLQVRRYAARLSGPLMDRIDIRLRVGKPSAQNLAEMACESSREIRERVAVARDRAAHRFAELPWSCNADIPAGALRRDWRPSVDGASLLSRFEDEAAGLRGPDRVLRIAWTLADLAGRARPGSDEIAMAVAMRGV